MTANVNVVIPTLDRFGLIRKTINSIAAGKYKKFSITIIVDDNREPYFKRLKNYYCEKPNLKIDIKLNRRRLGWPNSLNRVFKETDSDFYFYASDDLMFKPNTIERAMLDMNRFFPGGDGVIGITQQLGKFCPAAFGLIGRRFVNRFPERSVFYPRYVHFCGDSELWRYSRKIKRFHLSKAAVHHMRPFDSCKKLAQTTLSRDRKIWFPRRDSGQFWPKFK